jgi:hypothetical protein
VRIILVSEFVLQQLLQRNTKSFDAGSYSSIVKVVMDKQIKEEEGGQCILETPNGQTPHQGCPEGGELEGDSCVIKRGNGA